MSDHCLSELNDEVKEIERKNPNLPNLFPTAIWSNISFLVPEEFFELCEREYLPYHYASAIDIRMHENRLFIKSLQNYRKLLDFSSSYLSIPIKLNRDLRAIRMCNFRGDETGSFRNSLKPLMNCPKLQVIEMEQFIGSLEYLRACINLRIIRVNRFDGDLEPLKEC